MTERQHRTTSSAESSTPSALVRAERALFPAHPQEWALLMAKYLPLWGIKAVDWQAQAPLYLEALANIPADLLQTAMAECAKTLKFFPKPAEIRETIESELSDRKSDLLFWKREQSTKLTSEPLPKATQEDKDFVSQIVQAWKAGAQKPDDAQAPTTPPAAPGEAVGASGA